MGPFQGPLSVALTVAGSDSGGGAGVQADLSTFAAMGVWGTCAITAITAQNPGEVVAIHALPATVVRAQIEAVCSFFQVGAVKTGMLWSGELIEAVADELTRLVPGVSLVVDPLMVATSGARLLRDDAGRALVERLIPAARLVTPNLWEAAILAEVEQISSPAEMEAAARTITERYGTPSLVKGGHLSGAPVDVLWDGTDLHRLVGSRIEGPTHGTGCRLSAAIAAGLARGMSLVDAVISGKEHVARVLLSKAVPRST